MTIQGDALTATTELSVKTVLAKVDEKKRSRNVYTHSPEERGEKLAVLMLQTKAEPGKK